MIVLCSSILSNIGNVSDICGTPRKTPKASNSSFFSTLVFSRPKTYIPSPSICPRFKQFGFSIMSHKHPICEPGHITQSVTCLATDACLTADPGVASSIPARYHTFVEIDHEIISTVILPSADLFKKGCCQLQAKVCAQNTG